MNTLTLNQIPINPKTLVQHKCGRGTKDLRLIFDKGLVYYVARHMELGRVVRATMPLEDIEVAIKAYNKL